MHAETRDLTALVTEGLGLVEEQPYKCLASSVHQCDDHFATCSVSVTCSYENTNAIDLFELNVPAQTAAGEALVVNESKRQSKLTSPSTASRNRGIYVGGHKSQGRMKL